MRSRRSCRRPRRSWRRPSVAPPKRKPTYRQQYPTSLQFPFIAPTFAKPFLVRAIWHDGQRTFVKTDATELPVIYEIVDGKPSLVNFQVVRGTYVVPKVLDRGYLALGKQRFPFEQVER